MTHEEVRALLLSFPGVEDGVSYGEPSFKVAGKFFTWLRPKLDDSIVVHLDNLDERDLLIEMDPDAFHFTDHYRDYPIVLARIAPSSSGVRATPHARNTRRARSPSINDHTSAPANPPANVIAGDSCAQPQTAPNATRSSSSIARRVMWPRSGCLEPVFRCDSSP
mgnify:CR=1 FL=1